MITAKEARKQTDEIIEKTSTINLKEIDDLIKTAIKNGESSIYFYQKLSTILFDQIINLGYRIFDLTNQRDGDLYKIKW